MIKNLVKVNNLIDNNVMKIFIKTIKIRYKVKLWTKIKIKKLYSLIKFLW